MPRERATTTVHASVCGGGVSVQVLAPEKLTSLDRCANSVNCHSTFRCRCRRCYGLPSRSACRHVSKCLLVQAAVRYIDCPAWADAARLGVSLGSSELLPPPPLLSVSMSSHCRSVAQHDIACMTCESVSSATARKPIRPSSSDICRDSSDGRGDPLVGMPGLWSAGVVSEPSRDASTSSSTGNRR